MAPARKAPPKRIKDQVHARQGGVCGCRRKCGTVLPPDGKGLVQYQHDPALGVRPINEEGTDWIPPQHDPAYIFAEMRECHHTETYHPRSLATSLGSDRHNIDKTARLRGEVKGNPKRSWPSRPLESRGFNSRLTKKFDGTVVERPMQSQKKEAR